MVTKLSQRQQGILEYIKAAINGGLPPTVRDIQGACGISSTSVVDYNLRKLEQKGYIERRPEVSRGIRLVKQGGEPEMERIYCHTNGVKFPKPFFTDDIAEIGFEVLNHIGGRKGKIYFQPDSSERSETFCSHL